MSRLQPSMRLKIPIRNTHPKTLFHPQPSEQVTVHLATGTPRKQKYSKVPHRTCHPETIRRGWTKDLNARNLAPVKLRYARVLSYLCRERLPLAQTKEGGRSANVTRPKSYFPLAQPFAPVLLGYRPE